MFDPLLFLLHRYEDPLTKKAYAVKGFYENVEDQSIYDEISYCE